MKKFLVVLSVMALLASSAFALTTVTKENSEDGYPGILTPGSLTGTNTFISDLPLLANNVVFEYVGGVLGAVILKTDLGTIGISASPCPFLSVGGVNPNMANDVVGLLYSANLDKMTIGASLLAGMYSEGQELQKDYYIGAGGAGTVGTLWPWEKAINSRKYMALQLGAGLKGDMPLDIGLGVAMGGDDSTWQNLYQDTNNERYEAILNNDIMGINVAARMGIAGLTAALGVNYVNGSDKDERIQDTNNDGVKEIDNLTTINNSEIMAALLIGKDIKAKDTMTVKISTGVTVDMYGSDQTITEDKVTGTKTYEAQKNADLGMTIPINVAVEAKLNETWSINAGAALTAVSFGTTAYSDNTAPGHDAETWKAMENVGFFRIDDNMLSYTVGVTGKIGDLQVDWKLNPALLLDGPDFIGGNAPGFASNIALTYGW